MKKFFLLMLFIVGSFIAGSVFAEGTPLYFIVTKTTFGADDFAQADKLFKLLAANDKDAVVEFLRGENASIPAGTQVYVPELGMYHGLVRAYVASDMNHVNASHLIPWKYLKVDNSGVTNLTQPRVTAATQEEAFQNMLGHAAANIDLPAPRVTTLPLTIWTSPNPDAWRPESRFLFMWQLGEANNSEPVFQTHEEALSLEACILHAQKMKVYAGDKLVQSLYNNLASRGEAFKMTWDVYRFDLKDFPDGTHLIVWRNASGEQRLGFSVNDGYETWLPERNPQNMQVAATPTPTPFPQPVAVPEPAPQPAPAPLAMNLVRPTPTPTPQAPKSRWDTNQPTAAEVQARDLHNAEQEFYNALSSFSNQELALLKQEEDGWDAYFASIQDPAVKIKALRERAKYLRESYAYFKYHEKYQEYCDWCKANGKPVPPPLQESAPAPATTPTPQDMTLDDQEEAAEQEYRALWNPLTDKQRIALFQEQAQFNVAFQKLHDHGTAADRIKAYKDEIARMKVLIAAMPTPAPTPTSIPVPTPAPATQVTGYQDSINIVGKEYDRMWEAALAAQPESARSKLRDEEVAFRASLKGLDGNAMLQKLTQRMVYFQTLTTVLSPIKPLN